MRVAPLLFALLLGCGSASDGTAPAVPTGEAAPPPPGAVTEITPPPLPAPPPPLVAGATPSCPDGMLALTGGPATLGESDPRMLSKHGPNTVVPRGDYAITPFCIDAWPLPGPAGAPWPTDGLSKPQVRDRVEPMLWRVGRRLCTVSELMFASGGSAGQRYPWGESHRDDLCDPKDEAPDPMGTYAKCVSPSGAHEFQVRSTWARLDSTTLRAITAAGAGTQPGFDGGYTVWGGLVRSDTYYAPTNFGVHFHQDDAPAFNDDGLRTCAWSGTVTPELEAQWQKTLDGLRESLLLDGLTPP